MEIIQERLEREYDLDLHRHGAERGVRGDAHATAAATVSVDNPARAAGSGEIEEIREPWIEVTIIVPSRYIGAIMELVTRAPGHVHEDVTTSMRTACS